MNRDEATKRVMRSLSRVNPTRTAHLFRSPEGSVPVVVSLPNENASEVIARVQTLGGEANVAVAFASYFEIIPMTRNGDKADAELVINHDLSMGMLLIRIKQNPGKTIRLRLRGRQADLPVPQLEIQYA